MEEAEARPRVLDRILKRIRGREKREYKPRKPAPTLKDIIDFIAVRYFRGVGRTIVRVFELDEQIRRAGLLVYPELYGARLALAMAVSAFIAVYLSVWTLLTNLSLLLKIVLLLLYFLLPLAVFAYGLIYPSMKASDRKEGVESELPFFAVYLSTLARAGVPVAVIVDRVSKLKIFSAIRREAELITRDIRLLGKDPLDAVESNALNHPSPKYRDFMLGYSTTVKTGGDVVHYLEIRAQDILQSRLAEMRLISERMSLYTELYITFAVIATLAFYLFFTISSIFQTGGGGFQSLANFALYSFVVMPTVTIIMLYMVHKAQPKSPISMKSPTRALIIYGIPAALVLGPITAVVTGSINLLFGAPVDRGSIIAASITLSVFLVALSLPPAIAYMRESRKMRGMSRAVANFLRDLAEIRKTGLGPEKSIEALSSRDYGPLTIIVKKMATSLRLGLNLEEAVRNAVRGYKDWLLLASFRFLVDSVDLGGGNPEVLDSLARYAHSLVDLEEELRKRLRVYLVMPYIGAILVTASSILVLAFVTETLQVVTPEGGTGGALGVKPVTGEDLAKIALLLSVGAVFNSWLMGIMAGKIRDRTVAAGFIHAVLLVIITLVIIIVSLYALGIG